MVMYTRRNTSYIFNEKCDFCCLGYPCYSNAAHTHSQRIEVHSMTVYFMQK